MTPKYDAVIVGAGLSGLITGCYLSKSGLKTAIVEKNHYVGGYCSSFKRRGFIFDSAAHSLGSCREDGQFGRIFKDFNIKTGPLIENSDPTDVVMIDNEEYFIPRGFKNIVQEFKKRFPREKEKIDEFFKAIYEFNINSNTSCIYNYRKFSHVTFESFLMNYFKNARLKAVLSTFLGDVGLPSFYVNCFNAMGIFREFVLDGGYFVKGGMQKLPDLLLEIFKKNGGTAYLSQEVKKIILKNKHVTGITMESGATLACNYVISASDARTTFFKFLEHSNVNTSVEHEIGRLKPSVSAFIVYLGVKSKSWHVPRARTIWFAPSGDINFYYKNVFDGKFDAKTNFLLCTFPGEFDNTLAPEGHSTIQLYIVAPFLNEDFWRVNKMYVTGQLIKRLGNVVDISENDIVVKESASPLTLRNYTNNYKGACYGWASTVGQLSDRLMRQDFSVEGLYLTGHWASYGAGGTPMVAFAGRKIAELVLRSYRKKKHMVK